MSPSRLLRFAFIAVFVAWAAATAVCSDMTAKRYAVLALLLFVPLALILIRNVYAREIGYSLAIVAVLQPLFAWLDLFEPAYKTLPPNFTRKMEISGDVFHGIGGRKTVSTDGQGFRTTRRIDYASSAPTRVFFIGASTTEQIYLDDGETSWAVLERLLAPDFPGLETVNTGVSGLRAEHHLATFERIRSLHPDLVVFLVGVNDWNAHAVDHFAASDLPAYLGRFFQINDYALFRAVSAVAGAAGAPAHAESFVPEDGAFYRRQMTERQGRKIFSFAPPAVDAAYARTLEMILDRCRASGLACVFASQPHGYAERPADGLPRNFWMTPPYAGYALDMPSLVRLAGLYNGWLRSAVCAGGAYFVDLEAGVPKSFDALYDDVHFNERGARRVAEILAPHVRAVLRAPDPARLRSPDCAG